MNGVYITGPCCHLLTLHVLFLGIILQVRKSPLLSRSGFTTDVSWLYTEQHAMKKHRKDVLYAVEYIDFE